MLFRKIKKFFKKNEMEDASKKEEDNELADIKIVKNLLEVYSGTTIGSREENQDNYYVDSMELIKSEKQEKFLYDVKLKFDEGCNSRFFIVCDGMGGFSEGSVASQMVVEYFNDNIEYLREHDSPIDIMKMFIEVNQQIAQYYQITKQRGGTTISLLKLNKNMTMEIFNIGDSPIILVRDNKIQMLSELQSIAGIKLKNQYITKQEYENSNEKHVLLGFLGDKTMKSMQNLYYSGEIVYQNGDILLLSSDGLMEDLEEEELISMLTSNVDIKTIINTAGSKEGSDNVSAIMIKVI